MLHHIKYFLFKLKVTQPSEHNISKWLQLNYVYRLEYSLINGNYKTRKWAAEALGILGMSSSIPILFDAINDRVQNVSIAALNALELIECKDELGTIIIKKRFEWLKNERERKAKQKANQGKKYNIYRWERTSKKNFEMVKERLKRPIR